MLRKNRGRDAAVLLLALILSALAACGGQTSRTEARRDPYASFLASFGWRTQGAPERSAVTLPARMSPALENYNRIQLAQGYDLTPFLGETLEKYTYAVVNYPGFEGDPAVCAHLLVREGEIVGGDVCRITPDGFLHGFQKDESTYAAAG